MPPSKNIFKTLLINLSSLDFFSIKPSDRLTFQKNLSYSTFIGKFSSWIIIGITLAIFMNFGQNMFYHQNPLSIVSATVSTDPPYYDLREGFFIAFGLQDLRNHSLHYIDESIYTVQMIQRTKVGSHMTLNYLTVDRCSLDMVPDIDDLKVYYSRNQIDNLYCLKNFSSEFALQSTWDGPLYKNILINILPCKNNSKNSNICKSDDIIQAALNSGNYAMHFSTLAIDPNNYEKPIVTFGKDIYTPISSLTLTYFEMNFGNINFFTDKGFLFEDLEQINQATYLSNRQILSFRSDSIVLQVDMKLDKVLTTYIRKYDKIQTVLANIGGIIKALMLLANFLVSPFINFNFKLTLANNTFNFKTNKKNKNNIQITSNPNKIKNMTGSNKLKVNFHKKSDSKNQIPCESSETNESFEKLHINYLQYFISCCRDEISKLYKKLLNKGLNQIDQVLDISFIMNKLIEIDILKRILLDEDQYNLFEYIPKPLISNKEGDTIKSMNLHSKFSQKLFKLKSNKPISDVFHIVSSKMNKSGVDEKLLEMVSGKENEKNKKKQEITLKLTRKKLSNDTQYKSSLENLSKLQNGLTSQRDSLYIS